MSAPVFQAVGATTYGESLTKSVAWPAHATGDLGLLFVESGYYNSFSVSGWTLVPNASQGDSISTNSKMQVYYRVATSSSESDAVLSGSLPNGHSGAATIVTYRGASIGRQFLEVYSGATSGTALSVSTSIGNVADPTQMLIVLCSSYKPSGTLSSYVPLTTGFSTGGVTSRTTITGGCRYNISDVQPNSTTITGVTANFDPSASSNGTVFGILLIPDSMNGAFSSSGTSVASFQGTAIKPAAFYSSGVSSVAFAGASTKTAEFSSSGQSSVAFIGASRAAAAFSSVGQSSALFTGTAIVGAAFSIAGTTVADFSSISEVGSRFSIQCSTGGNFVGASIVEAAFQSEGLSYAAFFAPTVTSAAFSITCTSTAQFSSVFFTVTTLQDGSGGIEDGDAVIDWSICDSAEITLSAGTGAYSIKHINLILRKWITVSVINSGASGSITWDNGDAPVDWGTPGAPSMPADGETLHVQFYARSASEILGRLFW